MRFVHKIHITFNLHFTSNIELHFLLLAQYVCIVKYVIELVELAKSEEIYVCCSFLFFKLSWMLINWELDTSKVKDSAMWSYLIKTINAPVMVFMTKI